MNDYVYKILVEVAMVSCSVVITLYSSTLLYLCKIKILIKSIKTFPLRCDNFGEKSCKYFFSADLVEQLSKILHIHFFGEI